MNDILTVTGYGAGAGSSRVRVFDWLDHLNIQAERSTYVGTSSHSVRDLSRHPAAVVGAEISLRRLASKVADQTVVISRQASPFSNGAIERRLLSSAKNGVYDFDDALFSLPSTGQKRPWSKASVWREAAQSANCVIAGNNYLADAVSDLNSNVVVIPSCIEVDSYIEKTRFQIESSPRAVWIGSPSTEHFLEGISAPLLEAHRRTGLRLTVISSGNSSLGPLEILTDRIDWNLGTFANDLLKGDFGIMPLEDTPWTRGKCAYKLLQYGAARLPMIGSPVGANQDVLNFSDGLAPANSRDWLDSLLQMIDESASRRESRGAAGRSTVESSFSFAAWAATWIAVMEVQP